MPSKGVTGICGRYLSVRNNNPDFAPNEWAKQFNVKKLKNPSGSASELDWPV
jgi:hypothetical protein